MIWRSSRIARSQSLTRNAQPEQALAQLHVLGIRIDDALELLDRALQVAGLLGEHLRELELDLAALLGTLLDREIAPPQSDGRDDNRRR